MKIIGGMRRIVLRPKPPYNFSLRWELFTRKMPNPEVYEDGVWRRALRLKSGKIIPVKVRSIGTVDDPRLEVLILSKTGQKEASEVENKLAWIFNIDSDLAPLYSLMDGDPILSRVKEKLYGLRIFRYSTVFEGVVKSIVQQQISLAVSWYMIAELVKSLGDRVEVSGEGFYEFPAPEALTEATTAQLKRCGLSRKKAEYIKGFSEKVAAGDFDPESLKVLSGEEMVKELCKFKGIGRWTAELVVVTSTDKEALPADDLGARRVISNFYFGGRMISGNELREFAGRWGRLAGGVIYYLIYSERYDKLKAGKLKNGFISQA
jgi:DNA-3-methyladenine glycosylase II